MRNMIKIKLAVVLISAMISAGSLYAQRKVEQIDPEKEAEQKASEQQAERERRSGPRWYDKVSFGGNLGGGIGSGGSFFTIQPMAFYRITDNTMAGVGLSYYYWSLQYFTSAGSKVSISDNAYGFNLFAQQQLFDPVFLHAELMPLNFSVYNQNNNELERQWISSLYLGGGIRQRISDRSGFYFLVLYDVLYNEYKSFRGSPLDLRTGFYF